MSNRNRGLTLDEVHGLTRSVEFRNTAVFGGIFWSMMSTLVEEEWLWKRIFNWIYLIGLTSRVQRNLEQFGLISFL